jgi:hypothetical protein
MPTGDHKPYNEGWICSRCGKSNAPWVKSCECVAQYQPYYPTVTPSTPLLPPYQPQWYPYNDHYTRISYGGNPVNGIDKVI